MIGRACVVVAICCFGSPATAAVKVHALPLPLTLLRQAVAAHAHLKPATISLTQTYYEFPPMKPFVSVCRNGFEGPYRPQSPPPPRDSHAAGKECCPYGKATIESSSICRNDADNWLEARAESERITTLYVSGGRLVCHSGSAVEYSIGYRRDQDLELLGETVRAITTALSNADVTQVLSSATVTTVKVEGHIGYKLRWLVPPIAIKPYARLESLVIDGSDKLVREVNLCGQFGNVIRVAASYEIRKEPFAPGIFLYQPDVDRRERSWPGVFPPRPQRSGEPVPGSK